ncbi:MAG: hypothetical protein IH586_20995, partial [Anaerolineaceae bacterium]|nr:hypothetical protein [Anaerolineaceae bacterium]
VFNEPYWQECMGCGYTTRQQQFLYNRIKEIQNVPIFSAVDSMDFWSKKSAETVFADGVCDFCATWFYPFLTKGYNRNELIRRLKADLDTAHRLAPNSKIVWYLQSFAKDGDSLRMPDSREMFDIAKIVIDSGVDGVMWYAWSFNSLYSDTLGRHPELFPTIKQVYKELVVPSRK